MTRIMFIFYCIQGIEANLPKLDLNTLNYRKLTVFLGKTIYMISLKEKGMMHLKSIY